MRVIFHEPFDFVTLRAKNGKVRAMVAYQPGPDALTVKREHGEAAVAAGKATKVKEPVKREDMAKIAKQVADRGATTHGAVVLTDSKDE